MSECESCKELKAEVERLKELNRKNWVKCNHIAEGFVLKKDYDSLISILRVYKSAILGVLDKVIDERVLYERFNELHPHWLALKQALNHEAVKGVEL